MPSAATRSTPVMDLHCDVLLRAMENGVDLLHAPSWPHVTIPHLRAGGVMQQVFAVWIDARLHSGLLGVQQALRTIDIFHEQAARHTEHLGLARTIGEAEALNAEGRIAGFLWIEGGALIADDLALLRTYYRLGVRGMTLTWSSNIPWAGSSTDKANPNLGLSDFGRSVIREMNGLGMIIDLSHCSDQTCEDVFAQSTAPVIFSHSGCRAVCDHPRNVPDHLLKSLANSGGVIGICVVPDFLSTPWREAWTEAENTFAPRIAALEAEFGGGPEYPPFKDARRRLLQSAVPSHCRVSVETYLDHVDHAIRIAGPEHVALGSDFDGTWAVPEGMENAACWPAVEEGLRRRGYSSDVIAGILGDNARRVFRQVLGD